MAEWHRVSVDRRQQLDSRLGAALYRVACLKQQTADLKTSPRLAPKLMQEVERLAFELEQAVRELSEAHEALSAAKRAAESAGSWANLLFDVCPAACLVVSADGIILEANPAAASVLNVSARHLAGKPLHLFVNGQRAEFMNSLDTLQPDQPGQWAGRLQPRERSTVVVDVTAVLDTAGRRILLMSPQARPSKVQVDLEPVAHGS